MRRPAPGSPIGAERAKRFRERRFLNAAPTDVQFDRELRIVIIENITNESLTPAKAVVLVRERLVKRFSFDGIDQVIAKIRRSSMIKIELDPGIDGKMDGRTNVRTIHKRAISGLYSEGPAGRGQRQR